MASRKRTSPRAARIAAAALALGLAGAPWAGEGARADTIKVGALLPITGPCWAMAVSFFPTDAVSCFVV